MSPATCRPEGTSRLVGLWANVSRSQSDSRLACRAPHATGPTFAARRPLPVALGRSWHCSGMTAQPLDPRESRERGFGTSPSRSRRPKAAAAEGQRRLQCSGLVRSVTATRLARRLAESWGARLGGGGGRGSSGRARVTQACWPMSAAPRDAASQSETRRF